VGIGSKGLQYESPFGTDFMGRKSKLDRYMACIFLGGLEIDQSYFNSFCSATLQSTEEWDC
jgi:hypothetical protein